MPANLAVARMANEYAAELDRFIIENAINRIHFAQPDHISYLTPPEYYASAVNILAAPDTVVTETIRKGRRVAAARLNGEIAVGDFGEVKWVEVMVPAPKEIVLSPRIQAAGFLIADFLATSRLAEKWEETRNIKYGIEGEH